MIVRRCAKDHDVVIHKNNHPSMVKTLKKSDGSTMTLTYPNTKKYFLWVDGEIVKHTDSFKTVEEEFVKECAKKHPDGHGRIDIVKHKLINNKVSLR